MKKNLNKVLVCVLLFLLVFTFGHKEALAYNDSSTNITLDNYIDSMSVDFLMPKDGKVKLNLNVQDRDDIPGSLTFAIQTGYSKDSEKLKEITGITSSNGIKDMEIDLKAGQYYLYFELHNDTGDLTDTALFLGCQVEILPTAADNIPELKTRAITSLKDINDKDYEEIQFGDKDMDLIIPFTANKAGGLLISLAEKSGVYEGLEGRIYKDKECTKPVGESFSLKAWDKVKNIIKTIPAKGTYYIKFTLQSEAPVGLSVFKVKLYVVGGESRDLAIGKTAVAYQASDDKKITYKISVKNTGSLIFSLTPYDNSKGGSAHFRLLDKNKKVLTKNSYAESYRNDDGTYDPTEKYYTVTKGTYYLQVDSDSSLYELTGAYYKNANQAGTKKSNAKSIKIGGKTVEGYFTVSDKTTKAAWYKFTVPSSQYTNLDFVYKADGKVVFQIFDAKGKIVFDSKKEFNIKEGYYVYWAGKTYSKGTYYLKVYKGSKESSFQYAFQVNNTRRSY